MKKILYGIQGTGNGHITRAKEFIPSFAEHVEVDVLISGAHHDLKVPFDVKFECRGLGFYFGKNGGIDYLKTYKNHNSRSFFNEIKTLDTSSYDLIVTDFEPVSAWAAKRKNVPSVSLSHQSAILSQHTPRPKYRDLSGELLLQHFAPSDKKIGFHFDVYDDYIYTPVIRKDIRNSSVSNLGHYTVYLPAYSDEKIIKLFNQIPNVQWEVFSKHTSFSYKIGNVKIRQISTQEFTESMASCEGVICGAGFETPAETMYLYKKLLVVPMSGQYEQKCNAEALKKMGVTVLKKLKQKKLIEIIEWIDRPISYRKVAYLDNTSEIVKKVLNI